MTIHHVTFSSSGGAGVVAKLLVEGQRAMGLDSVLHKQTEGNLWEHPLRFPLLTLRSAIDHYVISNRSEDSQLSLTREMTNVDFVNFLKPEDVLHLHWVTGMFDQNLIYQLSKTVKKIIWTVHDMEPFTGGCHQSGMCKLYETDCYPCPQVRSPFRGAIRRNLRSKMDQLNEIRNLEIVAPTNWMADRAKSSHIFGRSPVHVIKNPISEAFFEVDVTKQAVRQKLGIPVESFVAVFIAADLDNPGKQVRESLDAFLESVGSKVPCAALLVGKTKSNFQEDTRIRVIGSVDSKKLSYIAKAADLHISMSKAESAGLTIAETSALGVMSVVRSGSGMTDMVIENVTGHVVQDFDELRNLMKTLSKNRTQVQKLSNQAKEFAQDNFRLANISRKYVTLYSL